MKHIKIIVLLLFIGCKPLLTVSSIDTSKNVVIDGKRTYIVYTSDNKAFHTLKLYKINDTIK